MNGEEMVVISLMVIGSFWVLRPVVAAIARRIAGEHRRPAPDPQERDAIAGEVQQLRQEMAELQERMDFAERLLAKGRDQRQGLPS
ncbi:MAG TPA: hypothetical protein VF890_01700 [Gemmatimonadales bacterium]